jgi:hypothetical protein
MPKQVSEKTGTRRTYDFKIKTINKLNAIRRFMQKQREAEEYSLDTDTEIVSEAIDLLYEFINSGQWEESQKVEELK